MKKALAIVFTLLILLPMLSKTAVFIWFKINQNYIANNLCVNKDSKEIPDCEGCCVLNKQLKKVDDNAKDNTPVNLPKENKQLQEFQWVYCMALPVLPVQDKLLTFLLNPYFTTFHKDQYLAKIIKPPCWVNSFI